MFCLESFKVKITHRHLRDLYMFRMSILCGHYFRNTHYQLRLDFHRINWLVYRLRLSLYWFGSSIDHSNKHICGLMDRSRLQNALGDSHSRRFFTNLVSVQHIDVYLSKQLELHWVGNFHSQRALPIRNLHPNFDSSNHFGRIENIFHHFLNIQSNIRHQLAPILKMIVLFLKL